MKGQPYGACQTLTALASGRRPQRPIAAGSPRRTRDAFRTGNPGEASSVTDAHNWAFRVTQKRQPDHLQAAQNRRYAPSATSGSLEHRNGASLTATVTAALRAAFGSGSAGGAKRSSITEVTGSGHRACGALCRWYEVSRWRRAGSSRGCGAMLQHAKIAWHNDRQNRLRTFRNSGREGWGTWIQLISIPASSRSPTLR